MNVLRANVLMYFHNHFKHSAKEPYSNYKFKINVYNHFWLKGIWKLQAHNKFPDFFRMGTFIDSTHMKL